MSAQPRVCVYIGEALGRYGFPGGHPFGPWRMDAFWQAMKGRKLDGRVTLCSPASADHETIACFHALAYIERVLRLSAAGDGYLDHGDTPAYPGVFEAAACVVGSVLDATQRLLTGTCRRAFVPIAGLHHAHRDAAAGFCVFNDCGVAIETLLATHGLHRVLYVDIDAHHGDGVYDGFADDPRVYIADIHEDGRFLYPGTGAANASGVRDAIGTKLNIPLPPGAGDAEFFAAWEQVEAFARESQPQFILLQCGADSLAGDPLADLRFSRAAHGHATERLCRLAEEFCGGRLLALGGGGYDSGNLGEAWTAVVEAMLETPTGDEVPLR